MNKQIPINEATDRQLRDFATRSLQLELHHSLGRARILAAMAPVHTSDFITVPDDEPAPDAPAPLVQTAQPVTAPQARLKGGRADADPKVEVTIQNGSSQVDGGDDVFVSVNGRYWQIQRNKRVSIPYRVFLVLQGAVRGEASPGPTDADGSTPIIITDVSNYPMQVHTLPTPAEIAAFHAATRDVEIA